MQNAEHPQYFCTARPQLLYIECKGFLQTLNVLCDMRVSYPQLANGNIILELYGLILLGVRNGKHVAKLMKLKIICTCSLYHVALYQ
jgi:hypothetical protein